MRRLLVVLAVCSWAPTAHAQQGGLRAAGNVTAAYDDNILNSPDLERRGIVTAVRPGILFEYATPRSTFFVGYTRSFVFYTLTSTDEGALTSPGASADGANLAFGYELSPLDRLSMTARLSRAPSNISLLGDPSDRTTNAARGDDLQFIEVAFETGYEHDFSDRWTLATGSGVGVTQPVGELGDQGSLITIGASVAPRLTLDRHIFELNAVTQYTRSETANLTHVIPANTLGHRWLFAERWSTELSAGIALPFDFNGNFNVVPVGAAGLHYVDFDYGASLRASRSFDANPTLQRVFYSDSVALSGTVPLWRDQGLTIDGAIGAGINRVVDDTQDTDASSAANFVADVGIQWRPPEQPLAFGARYQRSQQFDSSDPVLIPNVKRNVVALSVEYVWPMRTTQRSRLYRRRGAPPVERAE